MASVNTRSRISGFGLAEALVALLLLAVATLGAGTAMVEALAAQRAALLHTQATDFAADLAEALRSAPDPAAQEAEVRAWQSLAPTRLPQAQAQAVHPSASIGVATLPAGLHIHLQWRDGRASSPSQLALSVGPPATSEDP